MISCKKLSVDMILDYLGDLKAEFTSANRTLLGSVQEIRLRAGRPIVLQTKDKSVILSDKIITKEAIDACFQRICRYSVHSFAREISEGFITLKGGHRAGFSGTAVISNGVVSSIRDISGINFRIAREILGCADTLMSVFDDGLKSILIAGEPVSGKTTLLRDMVRQLAMRYKCCVIDERSELAATFDGQPMLNVGLHTDVLDGFPKAQGFVLALRSLSPEVIICDEIGSAGDGLVNCINAGVKVIATAHAASLAELKARQATKELLMSGAFDKVVLLESRAHVGQIRSVVDVVDVVAMDNNALEKSEVCHAR